VSNPLAFPVMMSKGWFARSFLVSDPQVWHFQVTPVSAEDQGLRVKLLEADGTSSGPASAAIAASQDLAKIFRPDADLGILLVAHEVFRRLSLEGLTLCGGFFMAAAGRRSST
jgi:hypothetical protein